MMHDKIALLAVDIRVDGRKQQIDSMIGGVI